MRTTSSDELDAAFVTFMQAAQPGLLRTAFFLTGSQEAAHELTQDALVRTYLAWPRVRRDSAYAKPVALLRNWVIPAFAVYLLIDQLDHADAHVDVHGHWS